MWFDGGVFAWFRRLAAATGTWWWRRRHRSAYTGVALLGTTADPAPVVRSGQLVLVGTAEKVKWLRFACPCGRGAVLALNLMPTHTPRWTVERHAAEQARFARQECRHAPVDAADDALRRVDSHPEVEHRNQVAQRQPHQDAAGGVGVGTAKHDVAVAQALCCGLRSDRCRVDVQRGAQADATYEARGDVRLLLPAVLRPGAVHAGDVGRVEGLAVEDRERSHPEPRKLLNDRRAGPASAHDTDVQGSQHTLQLGPEGPLESGGQGESVAHGRSSLGLQFAVDECEEAVPSRDVQIPVALSTFADEAGISYRQTLALLALHRQILAYRTAGRKRDFDKHDWEKLYESVKEFL